MSLFPHSFSIARVKRAFKPSAQFDYVCILRFSICRLGNPGIPAYVSGNGRIRP